MNITSSVHEKFSFEFIVGEFQISIEFDGKITIDLIGHPDNWRTIKQLGWLIDSDEKSNLSFCCVKIRVVKLLLIAYILEITRI